MENVYDNWKHLEENVYNGYQLAKKSKEIIASFFKIDAKDICITRNTTEGINMAAKSIALSAGDEVIISTHEHVGGASPWLLLEKEKGIVVKLLDMDLTASNNLQRLKDLITPKTKAVSISHVTCTTGMELPVQDMVQFCREKGIYSVIDGAQAVGVVNVDLSAIRPDFYACAAHKWLFGPKGIGLLYINPDIMQDLHPLYVGAYSDENYNLNQKELKLKQTADRNDYGTRNVSLLLGFKSAVEWIEQKGLESIREECFASKNYFLSKIDKNKIEILSPDNEFETSILTIKINSKSNESIVRELDSKYKIRCRYIYENELDAIRISFAIFNSKKQIDMLVDAMNELTRN